MTDFKSFFFTKPKTNQKILGNDTSQQAISIGKISSEILKGLAPSNISSNISSFKFSGGLFGLTPKSTISGLSNAEEDKFADHLSQIVTSEDFISDLSNLIDSPHANESEDDFVVRAKESMRNLLRDKLKE